MDIVEAEAELARAEQQSADIIEQSEADNTVEGAAKNIPLLKAALRAERLASEKLRKSQRAMLAKHVDALDTAIKRQWG